MSNQQNDKYIEQLWEEYIYYLSNWDGKNEAVESKIQEIEGELEDLGVDINKKRKEKGLLSC